jgi:hypothetical protein
LNTLAITSPLSPGILARLLDRATLGDPLSHLLAVPPDRAAHLDGLGQLASASESPDGTSRNLEQSRHLIGDMLPDHWAAQHPESVLNYRLEE